MIYSGIDKSDHISGCLQQEVRALGINATPACDTWSMVREKEQSCSSYTVLLREGFYP